MFKIPQNNFKQVNKGDQYGDILVSKNIDPKTNFGKLRVSPSLKLSTKDNDASITNMGVPMAFAIHDASSTRQYYAACGVGTGTGAGNPGTGKILVSSTNAISSAFANDALANTPTDIHAEFSDMVSWRDRLYVSTYSGTASEIKELYSSWTTNWFTSSRSGTFGASDGLKNLCPGFNGNLYFTDDDEINYVPISGNAVQTGAGTIDMLGQYRGIWIRSSSNRLWIGLMTFDPSGMGARGYVAMWDGQGTEFNKIFDISAPCALSCAILDDVPYIIDAYGILKKFTGSGFSEVARLPVANTNYEMPGINNDLTNSRWIHQRGMDVVDGKININVNNYVSSGVYVKDMPSGVWEYDEATGSLYHKNSPCASGADFGQSYISTAGAIFGSKRTAGDFLAGYGYYTDASTERKGIFYNELADTIQKYGSFVTPEIHTDAIEENWNKLVARFKKFGISTDSIWLKYRTNMEDPTELSITWASTTTFTYTGDLSNYVGYEVEIMQGTGAGKCAHIQSVAYAAPTSTVTLDETFASVTGTAKARMENWNKLGSVTNDTAIRKLEASIGETDITIQFKVCMQFTGKRELYDLLLINSPQQKAK